MRARDAWRELEQARHENLARVAEAQRLADLRIERARERLQNAATPRDHDLAALGVPADGEQL